MSRIPTFMPNLETLVLTGYGSSEGLARSIIPMFKLRAPALHHLRIENFGISWSLFRPESFCNLQHFTLCYLPMDSRLSLYNLMAFLVGMPLLRVLVIRQALQQSVPSSSASRISFSHLHTIILEATVVHMAFLLRSFATPPPPTSRSSLWRYEYPNEYCGLESLVVSRWGMRSIDHVPHGGDPLPYDINPSFWVPGGDWLG